MAAKVSTWVWILVAIAVVGILGLVALAGIGFYFVSRNIETTAATPADAVREFDAVKARFENQTPLVELDSTGRFVRAHTGRPAPADVTAPGQLHLMAFDPSDGRIVRFTLPFWLLRIRANASVDLNGTRMDLSDLGLTVEDLERYGSALIVDHQTPEGERVLVWSQ